MRYRNPCIGRPVASRQLGRGARKSLSNLELEQTLADALLFDDQ
jgi:hypothetical protein